MKNGKDKNISGLHVKWHWVMGIILDYKKVNYNHETSHWYTDIVCVYFIALEKLGARGNIKF